MIIPIILAGGSGTRLWPISQPKFPKQFAPLLGAGQPTLLQKTLLRLDKTLANNSIIICNQKHRALVLKQLAELTIKKARIILEPIGRNTAPAIAIAAFLALQEYKNPILLVLPSDHIIANADKFRAALATAKQHAANGDLVCFGIKPAHAETGYGYLKVGKKLQLKNSYKIAQFVEKPNLKLAQRYLKARNYYWNSGMFMFQAERYLQELETFAPDIYAASKKIAHMLKPKHNLYQLSKAEFSKCRSDSIDYAVMEHTQNGVLVTLNAGWSDIGSWSALWQHLPKDKGGNVVLGEVIYDSLQNSYVHATSRKVVAIGVKNCIIIETADAILVLHKDNCQNLKKYLHTDASRLNL